MAWRSLAAQGSSSKVALHTWPYTPGRTLRSRAERLASDGRGRNGSGEGAKVFSIQNIPIFPPNFAEGLHFTAFHVFMG